MEDTPMSIVTSSYFIVDRAHLHDEQTTENVLLVAWRAVKNQAQLGDADLVAVEITLRGRKSADL
jgi:hypothetical protein